MILKTIMEIKEEYIKESKNIIVSYNKIIEKILTYETILNEKKDNISNLVGELNTLEFSSENETTKKVALYDIMFKYEKEIESLTHNIKPLLEDLENIKSKSKILYDKILREYSQYTEEEIKQYIVNKLN
jgi:hypothetical protein